MQTRPLRSQKKDRFAFRRQIYICNSCLISDICCLESLVFCLRSLSQSKYVSFTYLCKMEKEHLIFGIRAIIEAIQSGKEVDKVFIQKEISGELMKDLMKVMKRANVNFSYVPVEKLNRLTPTITKVPLQASRQSVSTTLNHS